MTELATLSVDSSLAKGLRATIIRRITATRQAMDQAARHAVARRASMPSTTKGARKLTRELGRYLDRYALCSSLPEHRFGYWLHWSLRQDAEVEDWTEDQLTVTSMLINMEYNQCLVRRFAYPLGLSMHLVERAFQRLGTTNHDVVLEELIPAALIACMLGPACTGRCGTLTSRPCRS